MLNPCKLSVEQSLTRDEANNRTHCCHSRSLCSHFACGTHIMHARTVLYAHYSLLCSKLCPPNRRGPTHGLDDGMNSAYENIQD